LYYIYGKIMSIAISRSVDHSLVSSYRELSPEEIMFVSGGDDPGDSSSDGTGDDGASASVGSSSTPGTLGEVTVSAPAEGNPGGSGIGQAQAQQLMQNIENASQNPFFAFMLFTGTLAQAASNPPTPGLPALGNPMGDPDPGHPGGP
jgi:hypothetical protein